MWKRNSLYFVLGIFIILMLMYELFISNGQSYYYTSLGVMLVGMVGFFMHFEKGKPQALLLSMIAALCALAIVSRIAFFFLPEVKAIAAIVILAGIAFGGEVGFVTGAMSAFVTNFYFGQGSWTPFQMFALGLLGAFAGVFFYKKNPALWQVILYGFLSVLVLYGGIVDINTIYFTSQHPDISLIIGVYASALPFNFLFAVSTAVFLALLKKPILKRIDRVQEKYRLIDKDSEK